jgi:hypothetical protein
MKNPLETNNDGVIAAAPSDVQWLEAGADAKSSTALRRFQMTAYTGGAMQLAGWRFPVVVDMAGMQMSAKPKVFLEHDRTARVGHIDSVQALEGSLIVRGLVSASGKAAQEVIADAMAGFPWQASIGARATQVEWVPEGKSAKANGREFVGPVNIARQSVLGEVSFVALGADDATTALIAATPKAAQPKEMLSMEVSPARTPSSAPETPALEAVPGAAPALAPALVQAAAPAAAPPAAASELAAVPDAVAQMRAEVAAESQRIGAIRKLCAGQYADLEAQAIREGWNATKTELEVLRASRPAPIALIRGPEAPVTARVLEAACYLSAKVDGVEKCFDGPTLDAADERFGRDMGLQDMLIAAARANGYHGHSFRDPKTVMEYAFAKPSRAAYEDIRAAGTTIDLSSVLSNVANKFLLDGFFSVERTWRNICAVRNVSDFKTVTSYRLIGTEQYELVAPGGELKHGTLGNETYSNKADTYGIMYTVERRDIINDDLGAITLVPRKLGRGSGLKINDVFWTIFLNNATFFAAGNKNYLAGATTALSVEGLNAAEQTFADQVDSDGKPIAPQPAILLLPTALSSLGTQLYKSQEIRDTTASTKYPVNNPFTNRFRPEVSRYLGNSRYAGNSQKAWYLLAEPADLPVIEVAFLYGQESPTIESAESAFNCLGIQMRGYHDFGVALQDPRGGVKSKGEA